MTPVPNPSPNADDTFQLGNYVVCIMDLLGQKEKLKDWDTLPADGKITPAITAGLKATIGAVEGFYRAFTDYFETQRAATRFSALSLSLMNAADRELYLRQKEFELGVQQFSDTFVFYAPLVNSRSELGVLPVHAILGACSMAMLLSLGAKIPLRGAVHIGTGIKLPELSFYGPALAEAHRLECHVAQYPRVVVSPSLVGFVQHKPSSTGSPLVDGWFAEMLKVCQNMLAVDGFDNQPIVDWLGEGFRKLMGSSMEPQIYQALHNAHEFVGQTAQAFQQRFESSKSASDEKLFKRYDVLYEYLRIRLPDWGIKFQEPNADKP